MIFIRPWLLLLLIVPFLFRFVQKHTTPKTPWTKWVDKTLLPLLLIKDGKGKGTNKWSTILTILWTGLVIAASGPAVTKIPVPVSNELPNTVIMFDLGPSMQGATLASARIKLHDLLTALKGNRVGLVLYADKGYTAVPLTEDRSIIRALIPTLDPVVLPNEGQVLAKGFETANELIKQTGGKGRIIYITAGGVDAREIETPYTVGVLGMDDAAISQSVKQLGVYRTKTTDAKDILEILEATTPENSVVFDPEEKTDEWADLGAMIALILLPFFVLTFRRQFLFVLAICLYMPSVQAGFLTRPDQDDYHMQQKAVENYRKGQYEQAVSGFASHPYNRGNALAYAGDISGAINSYAEALSINPNDEDARFNKEYLEKQLPPPEEQENQDQEQQDDSENNTEEQQNDSEQQNEEEQTQNQDQESSEQDEKSENNVQPQEKESADMQQPQEVDEQDKEQAPFNQDEQQVLNRLNSDPYRVLRYRLQQQARKK